MSDSPPEDDGLLLVRLGALEELDSLLRPSLPVIKGLHVLLVDCQHEPPEHDAPQ